MEKVIIFGERRKQKVYSFKSGASVVIFNNYLVDKNSPE